MTKFEKDIIFGIKDYLCIKDFDFEDLKELIHILKEESIEDFQDHDFYIEFGGFEFRIISENIVDKLWEEGLKEQILGCYDLSQVPNFVVIDWDTTIENCKEDGKGQYFSTYDGGEITSYKYDFNIFRV